MEGQAKLTGRQNAAQFFKFLLFSVSAGVIQIVSYTLFYELARMSEWLSYLISLVLSVLYNFTVNRQFTFQSANNVPVAMLKVAGYYAVFAPLSTWWTHALAGAGWNNYLVEILTMVVNFVTEFLFCRFVVYRRAINTNRRAARARTGAGKISERDEALSEACAVSDPAAKGEAVKLPPSALSPQEGGAVNPSSSALPLAEAAAAPDPSEGEVGETGGKDEAQSG